MSSDLELGMATMFREATMQSVVLELRTPADWKQFDKITEETRKAEQQELDSFTRDKPDLLNKARQALIDKAGSLRFQHPTPFGMDQFNKSAIDRQAHIMVETAHLGRMQKIQSDAADAYGDLTDRIQAREQKRGMARSEFTRTVDRRSSQGRSMPTRER